MGDLETRIKALSPFVNWEIEHILEHSEGVASVAFSPDGTRVVSGSWDRLVRIWNAATEDIECALEGHSSRVTSVAFSPDGTHVVSGSIDMSVRIWSAMAGEMEGSLEGHLGGVTSDSLPMGPACPVPGTRQSESGIPSQGRWSTYSRVIRVW